MFLLPIPHLQMFHDRSDSLGSPACPLTQSVFLIPVFLSVIPDSKSVPASVLLHVPTDSLRPEVPFPARSEAPPDDLSALFLLW